MQPRFIIAFILAVSLWSPVAAQSPHHSHAQSNRRKAPSFDRPPASAADAAAAVDAPPPTAGDETVKLQVDLVVLDALVVEQKTARLIGNIKKEDLVVFEDGIRQEITHFSQDTLPLSVILMVDRGGCLDPFGEQMRRATEDALRRLKPQDEVALMTFADTVELVQGFGSSKSRLLDAIYRIGDHDENAGHCFNRAFYEAARYMNRAANPDGRRVIIMITATNRAFDCSGVTGEEARQAILESGSVVCGLIPKTPEQQVESRAMATAAVIGGWFKVKSSNLKQLVEETGGEIMSDKPEQIEHAFNNLVEHLRTRFSIGFVSSNPKRDGSYRKLKVEVAEARQKRDGKLVVKTRRGYLAGKSPAPPRVNPNPKSATQK